MIESDAPARGRNRRPAVAGTFYPADPARLANVVAGLLDAAARQSPPSRTGLPAGLLVPHAGLEYSGIVAASAWRLMAAERPVEDRTVVILGTNHADPWLDGIAVWPGRAWQTPLGDTAVDENLAAEVVALGPPFRAGEAGHLGEHSIEVQLPLLQSVAPGSRIVPLAVSAGRGSRAVDAGAALGGLLAPHVASGRVVLAISSDMAHYPAESVAWQATTTLIPALAAVDATKLGAVEALVASWGRRGVACGMCGIEPAVLGLAALRALGATRGRELLAATSADAGGPSDRVVGYLAMRFDR